MSAKKTLIIGASEKLDRYSNMAARKLLNYGHPIEMIGLKQGSINEHTIQIGFPELTNIDTVTLYINPERQEAYVDYILKLKPKRVLFNPGTENEKLYTFLSSKGIEVIEGCTLVMLTSGEF